MLRDLTRVTGHCLAAFPHQHHLDEAVLCAFFAVPLFSCVWQEDDGAAPVLSCTYVCLSSSLYFPASDQDASQLHDRELRRRAGRVLRGHGVRSTSRIVQCVETSRLARTYRHAYTAGRPSRARVGTKEMVCRGEQVLWLLE